MAPEIIIRDMTASDLDTVHPLVAQLGYDIGLKDLASRFRAVTQDSDHAVWVALTDDRIVGFLHIFYRPALEKPPEAVVQAMAVDQTRRKSGIGQRLLERAEEWALTRGLHSIALSSQVDRSDAHAFYARLGFESTATSKLLRKKLATKADK